MGVGLTALLATPRCEARLAPTPEAPAAGSDCGRASIRCATRSRVPARGPGAAVARCKPGAIDARCGARRPGPVSPDSNTRESLPARAQHRGGRPATLWKNLCLEGVQENEEPDAHGWPEHRRQHKHEKRLTCHHTQPRTQLRWSFASFVSLDALSPKRLGTFLDLRRVHALSRRRSRILYTGKDRLHPPILISVTM